MQLKYTSCFTDLIDTLNININYDIISECSSVCSNLTLKKVAEGDDREEWESRAALKLKAN